MDEKEPLDSDPGTGDHDHSEVSTETSLPATADRGSSAPTDPATRRRSLLKTLSVPPLVAALAGCPSMDTDSSTDDEQTEGGEPRPDVSEGEAISFGDAVRFADSYEIQVRTLAGDDQPGVTMTGRVHEGDQYVRTEQGETTTESYLVDGQGYVVTGEDCFTYPTDVASLDGDTEPAESGDARDSQSEVTLLERTVIDGTEVDRYERRDPEQGDTVRYDVAAETGYLRRVRTGSAVIEYSAWGGADPVTPPDVECQPYEVPTVADPETDTDAGTDSETNPPSGSPDTPIDPGDWDIHAERAFEVATAQGVQLPVVTDSTVLIAFETTTDFAVDVYTVQVSDETTVPDEVTESNVVPELSFPDSRGDRGQTVLESNDYAVFVDNTAERGVASPPSEDAVAVVTITLGLTSSPR
jgi:hypothetical protein